LRVFILVLLASAGFAQTEPSGRVVAITPNEIVARFQAGPSSDPAALWKTLGLPVELAIGRPFQFSTCGGCTVVSGPGRYPVWDQIIRICVSTYDGPCRYLYFRMASRREHTWRLIGVVDNEGDSQTGPLGRSVYHRFWVVTTNQFRGSGVSHSTDRWFSEQRGSWIQSLELPSRGNDFNANPSRSWKVGFLSRIEKSLTDELELEFHVQFGLGLSNKRLFIESRRVTFVANDDVSRYNFDPKRSGLAPTDIDLFFNVNKVRSGPSSEHFLRFSLANLLKIARGPNDWKKAWLREYLAKVKDTPEKRQLMQALAARP